MRTPLQIWKTVTLSAIIFVISGCGDTPNRQFNTNGKGVISSALSSSYAAVASLNGQAALWSLYSQKRLSQLAYQPGQTMDIQTMAFSGNERYLLTGESKTIALWDTNKGQLLRHSQAQGTILSIAIDGAGRLGAVGEINGNVNVINLRNGSTLQQLRYPSPVNSLALSHNGKWLLTAGIDHKVLLWDLRTGKQVGAFEHDQAIERVGFSPDDQEVVTTGMLTPIRFWNRETGKQNSLIPGRVTVSAFAFANDNNAIALGLLPDKLAVWVRTQGKWHQLTQWRLRAHSSWQPSRPNIKSVQWTPNRKQIITIDSYGRVAWWTLPSTTD